MNVCCMIRGNLAKTVLYGGLHQKSGACPKHIFLSSEGDPNFVIYNNILGGKDKGGRIERIGYIITLCM